MQGSLLGWDASVCCFTTFAVLSLSKAGWERFSLFFFDVKQCRLLCWDGTRRFTVAALRVRNEAWLFGNGSVFSFSMSSNAVFSVGMGSFALPFYHLASQVGMSSDFPSVVRTNSVRFVSDEFGLSFFRSAA